VLGRIHAAGGDRVQHRLPQMGPRPLHQGDPRPIAAPVARAQPCGEFQPRRPAADDNDFMRGDRYPPSIFGMKKISAPGRSCWK